MSSLNVDLISRYRVLRSLGQTQLGDVYLSISTEERGRGAASSNEGRSPGFFCLELLNPDWARDEELRELFLEEAEQTLQLEHPNVVRSQELLRDREACGRVTRWFAGHSLARLLERVGREAFPLHLHVRVLCEVLSALQYLHELDDPTGATSGIVYRDASPERVFLTYTGQVKLLGAGFERTIDEIERRSGHLIADLGYASPELCLGYPASAGGDVYSVGVMLWEALARARRSFAGTPEECLRLRISGEEPDVDQFRPGMPQRLVQICRRALAVSPRDRYPNAQELQIDLESFLADTETDAQQNEGLGALAQLMMQHFAPERAEMLTWIEQQLAVPEPSTELDDALADDETSANVMLAALVTDALPAFALPPTVPPPAPSEELASEELASEEPPALASSGELPGALLASVHAEPEQRESLLEPPALSQLWDEHTHNVTSIEELPLPEPARALPLPEVLAPDPDTSGHRAYSSNLQPSLPIPGSISRIVLPIALAAGVLLLVTQALRIAEREPSPESVSAREGLAGQGAGDSHRVREASPRDGSSEVVAARALRPAVSPPAVSPPVQPEPASASRPAAVDVGAAVLPAALARELAPPEPAPQALPAAASVAVPGVAVPPPAEPNAEPREPAMPTLSADALAPSVAARPPPRPRRAKPRPEARPDARAPRPSGVLPRSIDETDPYTD